jgi:hypothetical protein
MRQLRKAAIGAAAAATLAFGIAGCGNAAEELTERAIEEGTGGDVEIGDDGVTITDEEGNEVAIGDAAEVPETWPDDVPVPTGSIVSSSTAGGTTTLLVTVDEEPQPTFDALTNALSGDGWTEQSLTDLGGEYGGVYEKDGRTAILNVYSDGSSGSSVSIAVASGQ